MAKKSAQNKPNLKPIAEALVTTQSSAMQVQTVTQQFEGPLPPPQALRQYDDLVKGAAERIIAMAEQESRHRQSQESSALAANIDAQSRQVAIAELQTKSVFRSDMAGQILGGTVSIASICAAIYLGMNGHDWLAAALVGLPLAGIIRALRGNPTAQPEQKK